MSNIRNLSLMCAMFASLVFQAGCNGCTDSTDVDAAGAGGHGVNSVVIGEIKFDTVKDGAGGAGQCIDEQCDCVMCCDVGEVCTEAACCQTCCR